MVQAPAAKVAGVSFHASEAEPPHLLPPHTVNAPSPRMLGNTCAPHDVARPADNIYIVDFIIKNYNWHTPCYTIGQEKQLRLPAAAQQPQQGSRPRQGPTPPTTITSGQTDTRCADQQEQQRPRRVSLETQQQHARIPEPQDATHQHMATTNNKSHQGALPATMPISREEACFYAVVLEDCFEYETVASGPLTSTTTRLA
ncbi:hypothetical protein FHR94_003083 [Halomonas cerina]|uniref:Uncharacterized protein n=1 Tax=Halomonas cerina TaxID=447424 RepID=A0A839V8Q6_9GAMM|nr:hypothetical protein [Halomonas cerina]